jgi:hypothetical protein
MAFWKSQKLSILWITKIHFENISHWDLPFFYYIRMSHTKECTAKYHPVQTSFSTNIKVSGWRSVSFWKYRQRLTPNRWQLAVIFHGVTIQKFVISITIINTGLQLYGHNLLYYSGIFMKKLRKTSEIYNALVSVPPEIRMRHFENTTDKRYGLSKLEPYDFLLDHSNVTGL